MPLAFGNQTFPQTGQRSSVFAFLNTMTAGPLEDSRILRFDGGFPEQGATGLFERIEPPDRMPGLPHSAVVIIPGATNYYYDMEGRRLVEALRNLGVRAELHTLKTCPDEGRLDLVLLINVYEIAVGHGDVEGAMEKIRRLRMCADEMVMVLLECVKTRWFLDSFKLCRDLGLRRIWDLGLHTQWSYASARLRRRYRFVFSGLIASERRAVEEAAASAVEREIPWAFIGSVTPSRIELVRRLMHGVDPRGFVFLREVKPVLPGGPDIGEEQLLTILRRTKYNVWCAHHDYFYMESQRFRQALTAGATPIKVMHSRSGQVMSCPFEYLMLDLEDIERQLRRLDAAELRRKAAAELCAAPSLEQSLAAALMSFDA